MYSLNLGMHRNEKKEIKTKMYLPPNWKSALALKISGKKCCKMTRCLIFTISRVLEGKSGFKPFLTWTVFFASRRWTERPKNFLHCFGNWMKGLKSGYPGVMTRFCYRPRWRTRTNHEQLDWAILLQKTNPIFVAKNPNNYKDKSIAKFSLEASNINLPICWRLQAC